MPLKDPEILLRERFGLGDFRPGQERVIGVLLEGRSALAVFPTGGGKSLCYQLPALMLDGLTLVVSPLLALMKDQVDVLVEKGIPAARLDSTLDYDQVRETMSSVKRGRIKLLYVAPERLANEKFLNFLMGLKIAMMAVDEAHCISEWGHNFRPDYLKLAPLVSRLGVGQVLALTATATPEISADIRTAFGIREEDHVQTGFHRPNLKFRISPCQGSERNDLLLERLQELFGREMEGSPQSTGSAVVYVTQQHTAESVAGFLVRSGVEAKAYHAGLTSEYREELQERFMSGEVRVVVATIAFGMGIDKSDIRIVIHYNLPKSLENYVQETGRAGRDGEASVCEMLACADDLTVLQNFIYGDTPTPQAVKNLIDHLLRQGDEFDISRYELSQGNDIRPLVISTVLTYLELEEVIELVGPFYATYKISFGTHGEERVIAGYNERRKAFLKTVFDSGKRGHRWLTLRVEDAALAAGVSNSKVLTALNFLEEAGDIEMQPSGLRHLYRIKKKPESIGALAARMIELFELRESRDVERLSSVVALAERDEGCLVRRMLGYFGEELQEDCGECSRCRGNLRGVVDLPRAPRFEPGEGEMQMLQDLIRERHAALRTGRQLARFLCGLSSPATSRARLKSHDCFGLLEEMEFPEVLELVDALGVQT